MSLPEPLSALAMQHGLEPFLAAVPRHAPETRAQWAEWCRLWPVAWQVPAADLGSASAPLAPGEQLRFERQMALALRLAEEGVGREEASASAAEGVRAASADRNGRGQCGGEVPPRCCVDLDRNFALEPLTPNTPPSHSLSPPPPGNAAVIVDPRTDEVVASGRNDGRHPLAHATMVAIAAAAERDRRLWPQRPPPQEEGTAGSVAAVVVADASEVRSEGRQTAGNEGPSGKRPRLGEAGSAGQEDSAGAQRLGAAETPPPSTGGGDAPAGDRPYMCTGFDVFLVREPCIMCAMALVHARLARVVYCCRDAGFGALGGGPGERLHAQRSLNHHYLVYRLGLKDEE